MTYSAKPSAPFSWATSPAAGDSNPPLAGLVASGYLYTNKPAHDVFNYNQNLIGQWTAYLNTLDAKVLPLASTYGDLWGDFVLSGGLPATSANLTTTVPECVAYTIGQRNDTPVATPITVTASQDTYLDVDNAGALHLTAVANGAGAPAVYANSQRLAKLVSSGTAITAVTDLRLLSPSSSAVGAIAATYSAGPDTGAITRDSRGCIATVDGLAITRSNGLITNFDAITVTHNRGQVSGS